VAPVSIGAFAAQILRDLNEVQHLEESACGYRVVSAEVELPFAPLEHQSSEIVVADASNPFTLQQALHRLSLLQQTGVIDASGIEAASDSKRGKLKIAVRLT